jgi:hypothetical protein
MTGIGKISGQITSLVRRDESSQRDYWNQFLIRINKLASFRRQRDGYHFYSGGRLFPVGDPIEQNRYTKLTVGFRDSKPSFVDLLFDASTKDFETCNISFFLRDQMIDFRSLKKNLMSQRSHVSEESNGNFSTKIRNDGKILRLSGYPLANMITISRSFTRGRLQPSQFLVKFMEMNIYGN